MIKKPLLYLLLLLCACKTASKTSVVGIDKTINPYNYAIEKQGVYQKGAVASAHPLASMVGAEMLKRGGNAIDAAIAVQLALSVVYPEAGNLGGGGFLVAHMNNGKTFTLDYREMAPASAHRDMYLDEKGNAQTVLSQNGHLASGVPGTVAGLFASLKHAKLPFATLIQPAIDLAEYGFVVTAREATNLNRTKNDFIRYSTVLPVFAKQTWKAGDTLIQKELAATLKRIRDNGAAGFYEGETARLIVEEMKRGGGVITTEDLKNYIVKEREPIRFNYKGHEIISMPPPSSGGSLIAQMLKMVEERPLSQYGFLTAKSVQLMTEAERRAYADRAAHMGDPDFYKVPTTELLSKSYLEQRMADYDSTKASVSSSIDAGIIESEETTHISVWDQWGNVVAVTTTLNGNYGSKTVVAGAGFLLNNEMDDFSIKPGVPNMFGAVGGEANAIAPRKRMLSSMTPTIVLKANQPFMVVGTPGGTTIPTSVYQTIINIIDFNMDASAAVNSPKFHHQWLPDELQVEKEFPIDVRRQLENMGYKVTERSPIGRVELIVAKDGKIEAVADKRGDDSVAGF